MEAGQSLTSVIMVSFHTGPVLFDAIAAVLAQTEAVQLCLIDNGNPPDVVVRLQVLAAQEPRLSFVTGHGNVGFGAACNIGARAAQGQYLLLLNPDSLLPPDALPKLKHYTKIIQRPFMIGARLLNEDGSDQRGCRRALLTPKTSLIEALHLGRFFPRERLNFNHDPIPVAIIPMPAISGAFMFMAAEDFGCIKGFDEGYFLHVEDLDLCLRFRRAGGEIYFAPDISVRHIGGTSHVTTSFLEINKAKGFMRYFHQNFAATYPAFLLWLLDVAIWTRAYLKIALAKMKTKALALLLVLLLLSPSVYAEVQLETAFSPSRGATELVVHTIRQAHKNIRVAAYLLTSHPIANALIKAEQNGVDVKVVMDRQQCESRGSMDRTLAEYGVGVRRNDRYKIMHDKFMVIDDSVLELGSFNYTRAAEEQNAENVLVVRDAPETVARYVEQWTRLWAEGSN